MPTTSTPPPHPYATVPNRRSGSGFAISAMATGLLSLLTVVVAAFYGATLAVVGIVIAIIAIGLGVTALILKQRPLAPSIVGLASGALSILVAIVVGALVLGGTIVAAVKEEGGAGGTSDVGSQSSTQGINAEWPENMAAGSVTFLGGSSDVGSEIARSDAPDSGSAPIVQVPEAESAEVRIQLYVDYMCPLCGEFEKTNLDTIESALKDSNTVLELRPLTFLDRVSNGSYYSSRASAALACVAEAQPELAWKTHKALLDSNNQPEEGTTGPDNNQLIDTLDKATGGLDNSTKSCIAKETYVPFAQGLSTWLLSNPVPEEGGSGLMVSGTPTVVVNGIQYSGRLDDAAAFKQFLEDQGVTLK